MYSLIFVESYWTLPRLKILMAWKKWVKNMPEDILNLKKKVLFRGC